jgi:hypothetical protein
MLNPRLLSAAWQNVAYNQPTQPAISKPPALVV